MTTVISRSSPGRIRRGSRHSPADRSTGRLMRILVATDAWHPQVNGVVRTLSSWRKPPRGFGAKSTFLTPQSFRTFPLPSYRGVRLALPRPAQSPKLIEEAQPDGIHIATEGPIGLAGPPLLHPARASVHVELPYPLSRYSGALCRSRKLIWRGCADFTRRPRRDCGDAGARPRALRTRLPQCRAVAARRRHQPVPPASDRSRTAGAGLPLVGRIAVEKNLEAFLALDLPGTRLSSATARRGSR